MSLEGLSKLSDAQDKYIRMIELEMRRQGRKKSDAAKLLGVTPAHYSKKLRGTYPFTVEEIRKLAEWLQFSLDEERADYWLSDGALLGHELNQDPSRQLLLGSYVLHELGVEGELLSSLLYIYRSTESVRYEIRGLDDTQEFGVVNVNWPNRTLTLLGEEVSRSGEGALNVVSTRQSIFKVAHGLTDPFVGQSMVSRLDDHQMSAELRPGMFERILSDVYGEYTTTFPEHLLPKVESRLRGSRERLIDLLNS